MMYIDQNKMQQVIQEAFDKVSGSRRWQIAFVATKDQIESLPRRAEL